MAKEKSSIKRISIEKAEGGFQIEKHHEQSDRGAYKMPETSVAKHHGEVMAQIHDFTSGHGSSEPAEDEEPCPMCAAPATDQKSGGGGKSEKPAKAEKTSSSLSEKAAKAAK